ncbi:ABC transporter permease subunit, partial [Mesomycoplasma hyorhinis]
QWIPLRFLNTLFRIIPTIIFIYLFSIFWIGTNIFLLVAVITALRKSTSLVKQLNESINSINWEIYKTLEIQGKSKFQRIIKFVFPSIKKDYLSFLLFYFENQVQTLILLGSVGGSLLGSKISIVGQAGERTENILELMTYSWISWVFIAIIQLLQFYFNLIVQNKKISQLYLIKNLNTYFTKIKVIFKNKFSSDQ